MTFPISIWASFSTVIVYLEGAHDNIGVVHLDSGVVRVYAHSLLHFRHLNCSRHPLRESNQRYSGQDERDLREIIVCLYYCKSQRLFLEQAINLESNHVMAFCFSEHVSINIVKYKSTSNHEWLLCGSK